MFDRERLQDALACYKRDIHVFQWSREAYKWRAVSWFQKYWDIEAADFAGMLAKALDKTVNLLASQNHFPAGMILEAAREDPEKVRTMFRELYDESRDVFQRIQAFKDRAQNFSPRYASRQAQHYQDENAVSVYLWLRFPDKYYIYKYSEVKRVAEVLHSDIRVKKGAYTDNLRGCFTLYDEMRQLISQDRELVGMVDALIAADGCYADSQRRTLTADVGFYISRYYGAAEPGNIPEEPETENELQYVEEEARPARYWIYSPGNNASKWEAFYDAGIMAIGWGEIGDLRRYASKDEMKQAMKARIAADKPYTNAAHATWQFANEMRPGDVVFVKKGMGLLVGRGLVCSDYRYDPAASDGFCHIRRVDWTHKGEWPHPGQAAMKTLTDITPYTDYVKKLNALFEDENALDAEEAEVAYSAYGPEDFLRDVYMDEAAYRTLTALVKKKKNVILQGPPGVGKTYAARKLAYSMMGVMDQERVMMVQFHQSYSYEDFVEGFRPSENGFSITKGVFYELCKRAEIDSGNDYFFIIDEINRGNLGKIFGELFMLVESDKRGVELQLLYSRDKFSVPENVYILGMMNTADRSLALMDYALRRRFAFFDMTPGFSSAGFRAYQAALNSPRFDKLIQCVVSLNEDIAGDDGLGEGFRIGHSFFCSLKQADAETLSGIVEFEIIPLLREYWFDEPGKVRRWADQLRGAVR